MNHQDPTIFEGVFRGNSFEPTNVIGFAVNMEGANGCFLSPNCSRLRDYDLAHGFPQPHVVNGPNNGYYVQKEVQASSSNQFIDGIRQIQMFIFSYVNSFNV